MADTEHPQPPTLEQLHESLRGLYRLYETTAARCEALRILGVNKGVWTEEEFQDGMATLVARGREAAARVLANADPALRALQLEILRRDDSDPQ